MKIGIIGAGPAGVTAAVQLLRNGIKPIIFEKAEIGGLLRNANLIENILGFPNGISGTKYCELLKMQLNNLSPEIIHSEVISLSYQDDFIIKTKQTEYHFDIIINAAGTLPNKLELFKDCPLADYEIVKLKDMKEKEIAIIGGGDAAFDYAMNLSTHSKGTILNRGCEMKAIEILKERVLANSNIKYISNISVLSYLIIDNQIILKTNINEIVADYVLIAIGRRENRDFIDIENTTYNKLINDEKLFECGDIKNGIYRQASIAIGDAMLAAMKIICNYL